MGLWEVEEYGTIADQACWALFSVTTFIVILRIICRTVLVRGGGKLGNLGLDDYITILCILVLLVTCILVTIGSHHGLGRRMLTLEPHQRVDALRWNVIVSSVLIWSFSLPKFAIIAILKRILNYGFKTTVLFWSLALSSQACILATSVWWWHQCTPVSFGWDKSIDGTCASISVLANLGYFTSAYSAFLDIFFALYPIPFIMRLNMPLKSRVAVSVALGLSGLACIVSIYKLAIFGQIFEIMEKDPTFPVPYLDILGVAEGAILLICASLPALGPILRMAKDKYGSASDSRGNTTQQSGSNVEQHSGERPDNWSRFKGQRLDDPEGGNGVGVARSLEGSSVDDIPLVPAGKRLR